MNAIENIEYLRLLADKLKAAVPKATDYEAMHLAVLLQIQRELLGIRAELKEGIITYDA